MLYLTTAEQARAKGYTGVKQVFASATGSSEVTGEKFSFQANGKVLDGSGKSVNIGESGFITEGGNRINKAMSGVEQAAVGLQNGGDEITAVGLLTGQPEIAAVGGVLSNIGVRVEVVNNFATEGFNQETITKNGIKVGVNLAFGKLGGSWRECYKNSSRKSRCRARSIYCIGVYYTGNNSCWWKSGRKYVSRNDEKERQ